MLQSLLLLLSYQRLAGHSEAAQVMLELRAQLLTIGQLRAHQMTLGGPRCQLLLQGVHFSSVTAACYCMRLLHRFQLFRLLLQLGTAVLRLCLLGELRLTYDLTLSQRALQLSGCRLLSRSTFRQLLDCLGQLSCIGLMLRFQLALLRL